MNDSLTVYERGWIFRYRKPSDAPPAKVIVLIHGWTGDENSMEVFARGLPPGYLQLFPRGPVSAPTGYGWTSVRGSLNIQLDDLAPTATQLLELIDYHLSNWSLKNSQISLCGFSQGAAMSYALSLLFPERVERVAAMAGFLPAMPMSFSPAGQSGKPYYIAHGNRDDIVPVEQAHAAVELLQAAGAQVDYCETSSSHKLSTACFTKLADFLRA